jgi:hypothetical protein
MIRSHRILVAAVAAVVFFCAPASADLASSFGVYVYPTQGQTESQQNAAESACYASAQSKTGFNPAAPQTQTVQVQQAQGGLLSGGARGAAGGAAIGAIAGNAGEGAAIGAVAGGLLGVRRQNQYNASAQQQAQQQAQAQYQAQMNNFRTAFSACMNSKGYVAR